MEILAVLIVWFVACIAFGKCVGKLLDMADRAEMREDNTEQVHALQN